MPLFMVVVSSAGTLVPIVSAVSLGFFALLAQGDNAGHTHGAWGLVFSKWQVEPI
jgi:hypothetical protein